MGSPDLAYLTLAEAAKSIKARKVSPVELVQASLARIEQFDGKLNSFITVCEQPALRAAKNAEKEITSGNYRGSMHGIPIGVKDIYATKGIRTTYGSTILADRVPNYDSTAARRLNNSGAILIGKNHCLEFACGDHNDAYGQVHNPWNIEHTPGGSSSGSGASVAAGMLFGSMGSCTGSSIRGPASHCNLVGLKPTYGLVSRYGVFPLSWSLDHTGPLTRTVEDCALMLQAVAGYDANDPSSARVRLPDYAACLDGGIKGIRVGIPRELNEGVSEEVSTLVQRAIAVLHELGASVEGVSLPITGRYNDAAATIIIWSEAAQVHAPWFPRLNEYTIGVQQKVLLGAVISATLYHKAQQVRRLVQEEMAQALQKVDVLVGPVSRTPPGLIPVRADGRGDAAAITLATERNYCRPYNLTGMPAISVPCGFSPDGLPVGLQIAGRLFEDATVLKVAHAYEQATEWHNPVFPIWLKQVMR